MPLVSGTKLGPYEVVEPLGAGGMGEVYRARDTRLDRTVAIKILQIDCRIGLLFRKNSKVSISASSPVECSPLEWREVSK